MSSTRSGAPFLIHRADDARHPVQSKHSHQLHRVAMGRDDSELILVSWDGKRGEAGCARSGPRDA
jgi:hypothetical protein